MKLFTEKSWTAIQNAAEHRKLKLNFLSSKYHGVVQNLPENPSECDGFHLQCYQKFTAVTAKASKTEATPQTVRHLRSGDTTRHEESLSTSGILPRECLFCGQLKKKKKNTVEHMGSCETLDAADSIQNAAKKLMDRNILGKIAGIDLVAKEAKYHHSCKSAFLLKAKRDPSEPSSMDCQSDESKASNRSICVKNLHAHIETSLINGQRPELLTSLYDRYFDFCLSSCETPMEKSSLMRNLRNTFGERQNSNSRKSKVGHNCVQC